MRYLPKIITSLAFVFPIIARGECAQVEGKTVYCPLEPQAFAGFANSSSPGDLGAFLSSAFQFGLAIAAALAIIMIVWGGVEIMLSESLFKKEDGHKKIQDAIWGLILALVSWLILYTINPQILNWGFLK